jgi:hypothetical protein
MTWFDGNGTNAKYPNHFGGGIIALKLLYDQINRFGQQGLGLSMQLQTDIPSLGYWITEVGATTLLEKYDLTTTSGGASYNHIMFGGSGNWYYNTLAGLARTPGSRSWSNLQITPPGPSTGILSTLAWAGASIDTPMGMVSVAWSAPTVNNYAACGLANQGMDLTLTCNGGTFDNVLFASFGTPMGACLSHLTYGQCNANTSIAAITDACMGKSTCTIAANATVFGGDPCPNVVKQLAVALGGATCAPANPLYTLATTVPVNAVAAVTVPAMGPVASAVIREGGVVVWSKGTLVPGTAGINAGVAGADGHSVLFSVGSGSFDFAVTAN